MVEPVTLRGQHVLLEPISLGHVEPMRRLIAGQSFPWTTVPRSPEAVESWVSFALAEMERRGAGVFAPRLPGGGMGGWRRLFDMQKWAWRSKEDVIDACEIGHTWLSPAVQRTAVNTEAKLL